MKLTLESVGRNIEIEAMNQDPTFGSLWQGADENGVPVVAVLVVLSPLIAPSDERQVKFELDRETAMNSTELHPEVERFPGRIVL